jgi:hypothetical protein
MSENGGESAVVAKAVSSSNSGSDVAFAAYAAELVPQLLGGLPQELTPVLKASEADIAT